MRTLLFSAAWLAAVSVSPPAHGKGAAKCTSVGRYTLHLSPKGGTCLGVFVAPAPPNASATTSASKPDASIVEKFEIRKKRRLRAASVTSSPIPGSLDALADQRNSQTAAAEPRVREDSADDYEAIGKAVPPADPEERGLPPSPWAQLRVRAVEVSEGECSVELDLLTNPFHGAPPTYERTRYALRVDKMGRVTGFVMHGDEDADFHVPWCADVLAVDGKKD